MAASRPILLIEDNEDLRNGLALLLRDAGYTVVTATHGAEALQLLHEGLAPSIIVSDLMMPHLNGFEFRELQLHDRSLREIPFVVYSAITDAEHVAEHLHADATLRFPVDNHVLLEIVDHYSNPPMSAITASPSNAPSGIGNRPS